MNKVLRSLLLVLLIGIIIFVIIFSYPFLIQKNNKNYISKDFSQITNDNLVSEEKNFIQDENNNGFIWSISIPSIDMYNKQISESVDDETLENYIGHFDFSAYYDGNVCLAAHNSGFKNNFFSKLYLVNLDDKIIYYFNGKSREYVVTQKYNISKDDFSVLQDNGINELTLITCVPNSPDLRLCVKAKCEE